MLSVLEPKLLGGRRILLARAEQARDVLPEGLARLGVKVDVVPVYRAVPPVSVPPEAAEVLAAGRVDILTFTSSSTVHNFAGLVGQEAFQQLAARGTVASIGPITSATLSEYEITPRIEPRRTPYRPWPRRLWNILRKDDLRRGPGPPPSHQTPLPSPRKGLGMGVWGKG